MLSREQVRNSSAIFALGSVTAVVGALEVRLADPAKFGVPLPDYLAHWTGSRMLLDGLRDVLYSPNAQLGVQSQLEGTQGHLAWFVSPPFVAALYAPLALLPYAASALVWTAISLGVLSACITRMGEFCTTLWANERRLVILVIAASYPVFELLAGGQDSALSLAVWMAGMHLAGRHRYTASGAVFALGLIKPQVVALVPLVFLLQRRWRGLLAFSSGGLLLGSLSLLLVGTDGAKSWLTAVGSPLYSDQVTVGQSWKMASLPALATALTSPLGTGSAQVAGYVMAGIMALVFLVRAARRDRRWSGLLPAALATTVAASPHLVLYDAVLSIPVVLVLLEREETTPHLRFTVALAFVLAWLAPAFHAAASRVDGPLGVVDAPWVAIPIALLWWRMLSLGEVRRDADAAA